MRRDSAALGDAGRRAQHELGEGRERLRAAQYEAQRRCQQAEGERAALAEQLAALREHTQGGRLCCRLRRPARLAAVPALPWLCVAKAACTARAPCCR
jgi:hypothetical protein